MKNTVRVRLGGRWWTVKLVPEIVDKGVPCWGLCDRGSRTIYLIDSMRGTKMARYFLHEAIHAQQDWLDEEYVDEFSRELAEAEAKFNTFLYGEDA